jgi:hypothetical protein
MAFNYSPKIITDGLVLYLDAANTRSYPGTGTTWSDLSRGGNNGVLTNGPTFNSANGGSIVFDGVDDYVNSIGTTSTFDYFCSIGTFSIGFWLNPNAINVRAFFIGNTLTNTEKGWFIAVEYGATDYGNNCIRFHAAGNATNTRLIAGSTNDSTVTTGWKHYFYTVTNGNYIGQWYINGVSSTTTTRVGTGNADQGAYYSGPLARTLNIGRSNYTSTVLPLAGRISNVLVYNRQLSAAEVLQNYNATKGRYL